MNSFTQTLSRVGTRSYIVFLGSIFMAGTTWNWQMNEVEILIEIATNLMRMRFSLSSITIT